MTNVEEVSFHLSGKISQNMTSLETSKFVTILGRWQPPHLGHQAAIHALCDQFERVVIGIGSSNVQDYRNPFSLDDVIEMLILCLHGYRNFTLIPVRDVIDDQVWCDTVIEEFGNPRYFVTANPYVNSLLSDKFLITHPANFIPEDRKTPISATLVRREMARGDGWYDLVPANVKDYIINNQLDKRFREEFGLYTLAMETIII